VPTEEEPRQLANDRDQQAYVLTGTVSS